MTRTPLYWIDAVGVVDGDLIVLGWSVRFFDGPPSEVPLIESNGKMFEPVLQFNRPDVVNYLVLNGLHNVTPLDAAKSFVFIMPDVDLEAMTFHYGSESRKLATVGSTINNLETVRHFEQAIGRMGAAPAMRSARLLLRRIQQQLDNTASEASSPKAFEPAAERDSGVALVSEIAGASASLRSIVEKAVANAGLSQDPIAAQRRSWAATLVLGSIVDMTSDAQSLTLEGILDHAKAFVDSLADEAFEAAFLRDVALIAELCTHSREASPAVH